jgi:hypothetical protein
LNIRLPLLTRFVDKPIEVGDETVDQGITSEISFAKKYSHVPYYDNSNVDMDQTEEIKLAQIPSYA